MKPNDMISDTRLQWLGSGGRIGSQTIKQALNFAQKAFIMSFKPLYKQIDSQTLNRGSHPPLIRKKTNVIFRIGAPDLTI